VSEEGPRLRTERLLLRRWRAEDRAPFAAMNGDAEVMEHFPATLSYGETVTAIERIEATFEERGYGLWALELPREEPFIGFAGLAPVGGELPFAPAVEVGWRLARVFWGRGLASEAAAAALAFAFGELDLPEVVAFTARGNLRSRRVMERLGMRRRPSEDFEHPLLAEGHRLRAHVLYRIDREGWERRARRRIGGSPMRGRAREGARQAR
jgi:ribosomal-protein-alanine N-acetyltransferase